MSALSALCVYIVSQQLRVQKLVNACQIRGIRNIWKCKYTLNHLRQQNKQNKFIKLCCPGFEPGETSNFLNFTIGGRNATGVWKTYRNKK